MPERQHVLQLGDELAVRPDLVGLGAERRQRGVDVE